MHTDFIPRPDADFNTFFTFISNYITDNAARWGHIPLDDEQAIEEEFVQWSKAYKATLVPHYPQLTAEKNRARITTERALRAFINRFLRWPPVTDLDRDNMGIRNPDHIRTPSPVPTTVPEIEVNSSVIRQLGLRMRDHGATGWGKPAHVHGMDLAWGIKKDRPEHIGELNRLEHATANPIVLTFEEEERGSRIFFSARWLNSTAQPGPWSDIESAIVP